VKVIKKKESKEEGAEPERAKLAVSKGLKAENVII